MLNFKGKVKTLKAKEFNYPAIVVEKREEKKNAKIRFSEDAGTILNLSENRIISIVSNKDGDKVYVTAMTQAETSEFLLTKNLQKLKNQVASSVYHELICSVFDLDDSNTNVLVLDKVPADVISKEDLEALPKAVAELYNRKWYQIITKEAYDNRKNVDDSLNTLLNNGENQTTKVSSEEAFSTND